VCTATYCLIMLVTDFLDLVLELLRCTTFFAAQSTQNVLFQTACSASLELSSLAEQQDLFEVIQDSLGPCIPFQAERSR
jgi:hypothetical protein